MEPYKTKPYQYLQISTIDIDGVLRTKVYPQCNVDQVIKNGVQIFCGIHGLGLNSEYPHFEEIARQNYGNGLLNVHMDTILFKKWYEEIDFNIAHCLGEMQWYNNRSNLYEPSPFDCRFTLRQVLSELEDEGFELLSSFEYEFCIFDCKTLCPVSTKSSYCDSFTWNYKEHMSLLRIIKSIEEAGFSIDYFHMEGSPSQVEVPLAPAIGLKASDKAILFKMAIQECAKKEDLRATFMTQPMKNTLSSGAHFNFSLRHKNGDNVMFDTNSELSLSNVAQQFLAGIMKHIRALNAFCAPTVNCYRRVQNDFSPQSYSVAIEDRCATIRIKNRNPNNVYCELRIPTAASNPYLVTAAVILAGLDGIKNKISLTPDLMNNGPLNKSLSEALEELECDSLFTGPTSLMAGVSKLFIGVKRNADLISLSENDFSDEALEKERSRYL